MQPQPVTRKLEAGLGFEVPSSGFGVPGSPDEAAIFVAGAFARTPEFAGPEQFAGVGVDTRSDIYSLGVALWQVTASNPEPRTRNLLARHLGTTPLNAIHNLTRRLLHFAEVFNAWVDSSLGRLNVRSEVMTERKLQLK